MPQRKKAIPLPLESGAFGSVLTLLISSEKDPSPGSRVCLPWSRLTFALFNVWEAVFYSVYVTQTDLKLASFVLSLPITGSQVCTTIPDFP